MVEQENFEPVSSLQSWQCAMGYVVIVIGDIGLGVMRQMLSCLNN